MVNIFLFFGIAFLLIFIIGKLLEKIRIPWIFAALLVGAAMSIYTPFKSEVISPTFNLLAQLGMYFLLFIIGFEINLSKLKKSGKFIIKTTIYTLLLSAIAGALIVHFLFHLSWFISFLVALSFATVGEAILVPILDEFKIVNTKLGQTIIGVGTLDDIIEILLLILIGILVGSQAHSTASILITLTAIVVLFLLTYGLKKLKESEDKFNFTRIEVLFLLILFVLFIFIGIGEFAHAAAIAALLAGIGLNAFLPENRKKKVMESVKTICYGFFAPLFFLWIGASIDFTYLLKSPFIILLIVIVSNIAKLIGSYISGRKEKMNKKELTILGVGLSVRFSTSIIIVKILLDHGLIGSDLYSVIIASSIIFTFLVPVLFTRLLLKWKIVKKKNLRNPNRKPR